MNEARRVEGGGGIVEGKERMDNRCWTPHGGVPLKAIGSGH